MKMVKGVIAVSLVAFLGLMGAVSMAEARYVGHGYHGIARGYGGYRHYGYGGIGTTAMADTTAMAITPTDATVTGATAATARTAATGITVADAAGCIAMP
jgi:hypothetical protein